MSAKFLSFAFGWAFLAGCQGGANQAVTADEALEIANSHFAEVLPQVPLSTLRIETLDVDGNWHILYYPPEGSTGNGPFVIDVSKNGGEIMKGLR